MENEFENQNPQPEVNPEDTPEISMETADEPQTAESIPQSAAEIPAEKEENSVPRYTPDPSSSYRWVNPNAQTANQTRRNAPQKKKKKFGIFKKIVVALLLIVFAFGSGLTGGVIGAGVIRLLFGNGDSQNSIFTPNDGQANIQVGDRENTVIDITKVDTGKLMTAAEVYALNVNSTVGITTSITTNYWGYATTSAASGSGFVYSDEGHIVTNYHVVEGSSAITVSLYDGSSLPAKLIGYDESNDVAVLKVQAKQLKPVVLGDSDNLNVGDSVVAIGNPLGELTFSLTSGAVSALDREVTFSGGQTMNLIQTDCAINSGNSGGALFNLYGEVIGVTNAKYSGNSSSGATIDNIGFAIPMNHVRTIVDSIIQNGYVIKPYIGVSVTNVSDESLGYGMPQGASIQGIVENGPAEAAGLKVSDIVTHINGDEIKGASDLKRAVTSSKPGDILQLTVWRRGETLQISITVGEQSQNDMSSGQVDSSTDTMPQIPDFPFFGW